VTKIDCSWLGATNEDLAGLFEVNFATIATGSLISDFKKAGRRDATSPTPTSALSLLNKAKGFTPCRR